VRIPSPRRILVFTAITLAGVVSIGGGTTFIALEITTRPQFCRTCHIMEPYYQSWASSGHKNVACVECHYEPGLLETFEGKFKALSQLAKYVTGTQGTKPWAEVSDYSCMRSGCHSHRLIEGQITFGRTRFDHRPHLVGFRGGKKLRCTSCHSQIVQGNHLTVTKSTCILCHFLAKGEERRIDDCNICHGPPPDAIKLGDKVFRHSDYLSRGVKCLSCHGDVTRGTGAVPRERCGSCHNKQAHLNRYDDTEFIHTNHVTKHSVKCLACHTRIEHSLPSRKKHEQGTCRDCHVGQHEAPRGLFRGVGGRGVPDRPGVMYLARVTCNGCHRPPFPGAPAPLGGTTFKADPLACLDCHGPGFEGMAGRWQKEMDRSLRKAKAALDDLHDMLQEEWEEGDPAAAKKHYDDAAYNVGLVLLDGSGGVHNLPYARALLRQAQKDLRAGVAALDPDESPGRIPIGPFVASKQGCTQLCHTGIEARKVTTARGLPFNHTKHLVTAKLDCSTCHEAKPHGTVAVQRADCRSCHHKAEDADACGACHKAVRTLWERDPGGGVEAEMRDLDCLSCHESLAEDPSPKAIRAACDECHDDKPAGYFKTWVESGREPLRAVEKLLSKAPPKVAAEIRAEIESLREAGPWHNRAYVQERAKALAKQARGQ